MDTVSRQELRALVESTDRWCVSLTMPALRAGAETQQNPIRFKNLLRKAEEQMARRGMRSTEVDELLRPAYSLLNDPVFWRHQEDGLAVFLSPKLFRSYRLGLQLEEGVSVDDRFHVLPLLPLLTGDGRFYLLALAQGQVRVFQGSRQGLHELDVKDVPRSLDEALLYVDVDAQAMNFRHSSANAAAARAETMAGRGTVFPGHGDDEADSKERILHFFRLVDKGLHEVLREEKAPLLLAGVEFLHPIYHEANTYPHLLEEGLEGNAQAKSAQELHAEAWTLLEPHFRQARDEAMARFLDLKGTARGSCDPRQIIPAAHDGRVESLFVARGAQRQGSFHPETHSVVLGGSAGEEQKDLLELAATYTLLGDGRVYVVEPDQMPEHQVVGAVFRY